MAIISFENVSVSFGDRDILRDINLTLTEQRIGIIGANGGGKSTLIRLINGLGDPTSGTVLVDGQDVNRHGKDIRKKVGFVFSDAENQIIMPTVAEDVEFSLRRSRLSKEDRKAKVLAVLDRFGLSQLAENSPHTLSGGEKQLLALASVLVMNPSVVIADEPTTLLDLRNRDRIAAEFADLAQQLIVVSHDLEFFREFDRVLCIGDGHIQADGAPTEVLAYYRESMRNR